MGAAGMVMVGAGEAGARAASHLREQGYAGPVTLVGDEPHPPYERPPLSKRVVSEDGGAAMPFILDEATLAERDIRHLRGLRAERIDRGARRLDLADGTSLAYDRLLVATGAGSRRLACAEEGAALYLRSFADALALRSRIAPGRSLVVIGGGFIGLEVAAGAVARGCAVTLVEAGSRLLTRGVPAAVSARVAARHAAAGVSLRIGVGVERVSRRSGETIVALSDGSELRADAAVAGIGAVPETALAAGSGLAVENGIRVDAQLRTMDPHVFAAGDCCSFPHPLYGDRRLRLEAWRNARDQGEVAARNMLGAEESYAAVPWFWSDQYDETLQVAGLPDEGERVVERDLGAGRLFFHLAADGRLVAVCGVGPNGAIARDVRLGEMLIARRARPDPDALARPGAKLKAMLDRAAASPPLGPGSPA